MKSSMIMVSIKEIYEHNLKTDKSKVQKGTDYDVANTETTIFKTKSSTLIFVAGSHGTGRRNFIRFLQSSFRKTKPDIVLLERRKDLSKDELLKMTRQPKTKWTEVEWLIDLANKNNVEFKGMDAGNEELFKPFIEWKDKDGIKAGLLRWALNEYSHIKRTNICSLSNDDIYDLAIAEVVKYFTMPTGRFRMFNKEFMKLRNRYQDLGMNDFMRKVLQEAVNKYTDKKPFLVVAEYGNIEAPYPWNQYVIGKLIAWWDAYRNKSMIDECVKAMKKNCIVYAVAGAGHIIVIRDLLENEIRKEFGQVKVMRWSGFAKA